MAGLGMHRNAVIFYKGLCNQMAGGTLVAKVHEGCGPTGHCWTHGGDCLLQLYPDCLLDFLLFYFSAFPIAVFLPQ